MKGKLYTIIGILAVAVLVPATACLAQKVTPKQPAKTFLPAKKYTLADPDRNALKPKMEPDLFTRGLAYLTVRQYPFIQACRTLVGDGFAIPSTGSGKRPKCLFL